MEAWTTPEEIAAVRSALAAAIPGWQAPAAYGVARVGPKGVRFAHLNAPGGGTHALPALVLATVCGHSAGTATYELPRAGMEHAVALVAPAEACKAFDHPNLWSWRQLVEDADATDRYVAVFVQDMHDATVDAIDAAFRAALPVLPPDTATALSSDEELAVDAMLHEQIDFYEADSEAYDQWLVTLADIDNDSPEARAAQATTDRLEAWLASNGPLGDVLEIAAGTGRVSQLLCPHAARLLLLDTSPTSLALADAKLVGRPAYDGGVCADVFDWHAPRPFGTVVFAAWLHHVPTSAFDRFWDLLNGLLVPGGRVLFDFALPPVRPEVHEPPATPSMAYAGYHDHERSCSVRDLGGKRWRVVHETWTGQDLAARLAALGWTMRPTGPNDGAFQWSIATRQR